MPHSDDDRLERGESVRRAMFGDDLVDQNYVRATDFQRPVQDWLAGAVWADVWTRGGLDRRTRSLATIAMLAAMNRPDELEMHVMAAVVNGCTVADIQEILLQVAPYCGAPAALNAFRLAERVLRRVGALDPSPAASSEKGTRDGIRQS